MLKELLEKKAEGYLVTETTMDYSLVEGELVETKRKVQEKYVPPDLNAIKMLLESEPDDYENWSDEQLMAKRQSLLQELKDKKSDDA